MQPRKLPGDTTVTQTQSPTVLPFLQYKLERLIALTSSTLFACILALAGIGFGTLMVYILYLLALTIDRRGTRTLRGLLDWSHLKGKRFWFMLVAYLLLLPITFLIYIYRVWRTSPNIFDVTRNKDGNIGVKSIIVPAISLLVPCLIGAAIAMHPNKPNTVQDLENTSSFPAGKPSLIRSQATKSTTPTISPTSTLSILPTVTAKPISTPTAIAQAIRQPTTIPTPRPSPSPTAKSPSPTPLPAHLSVTFTCASATDYGNGEICIHTQPNTSLQLTVNYCSGYDATSRSLQGTFYANGSGDYSWSWEPETKCRGTATATVTAEWNGEEVTNSDNFTVN